MHMYYRKQITVCLACIVMFIPIKIFFKKYFNIGKLDLKMLAFI